MSKEKQKGTRWEREVADYLNVDRSPAWGVCDQGDLNPRQTYPFTIECKNHKTITLSSFVDEAVVENENADGEYPAVVIKRPRKNVKDAYVVMPLWAFRRLMKELQQMNKSTTYTVDL